VVRLASPGTGGGTTTLSAEAPAPETAAFYASLLWHRENWANESRRFLIQKKKKKTQEAASQI
jgi:hypothetical protein